MQEREIIHEFAWTQLLAWNRDNYSESDDSDGDIHDDAKPNSIADWDIHSFDARPSSTVAHADIATRRRAINLRYDKQIVKIDTIGHISIECTSCDWATQILEPSKARQKLRIHELKHSEYESDEDIQSLDVDDDSE